MGSPLPNAFAPTADIVLPFQGTPEVGKGTWMHSLQECSRNTPYFVFPHLGMTQAPAVARVGQRALLLPGKISHAVKSCARHTLQMCKLLVRVSEVHNVAFFPRYSVSSVTYTRKMLLRTKATIVSGSVRD